LHVYEASISPRTYLHVPVEVRGNMNSQWSQRTSGFGAGLYPACSFESPHIFGIAANTSPKPAPMQLVRPLPCSPSRWGSPVGSASPAR
jgi:hypothetical protein